MAFQDVIKMVNEGKDPPGIRTIPEQLSSDSQRFLGSTSITSDGAAISREAVSAAAPSLVSPLKPWETQQPEIEVLKE